MEVKEAKELFGGKRGENKIKARNRRTKTERSSEKKKEGRT